MIFFYLTNLINLSDLLILNQSSNFTINLVFSQGKHFSLTENKISFSLFTHYQSHSFHYNSYLWFQRHIDLITFLLYFFFSTTSTIINQLKAAMKTINTFKETKKILKQKRRAYVIQTKKSSKERKLIFHFYLHSKLWLPRLGYRKKTREHIDSKI